jgi:hypothetical protein
VLLSKCRCWWLWDSCENELAIANLFFSMTYHSYNFLFCFEIPIPKSCQCQPIWKENPYAFVHSMKIWLPWICSMHMRCRWMLHSLAKRFAAMNFVLAISCRTVREMTFTRERENSYWICLNHLVFLMDVKKTLTSVFIAWMMNLQNYSEGFHGNHRSFVIYFLLSRPQHILLSSS